MTNYRGGRLITDLFHCWGSFQKYSQELNVYRVKWSNFKLILATLLKKNDYVLEAHKDVAQTDHCTQESGKCT